MNEEMLYIMSFLHTMLRVFDNYIKLIYLLRAEIFIFSDNQNVLGRSFQFFKQAKIEIQQLMKESTGMIIDIPDGGRGGTSTTGNVVCRLLRDHRKLLSSFIVAIFQKNRKSQFPPPTPPVLPIIAQPKITEN